MIIDLTFPLTDVCQFKTMGKCSVVGIVKIRTNQKWMMSNDFTDVMHLRSACI